MLVQIASRCYFMHLGIAWSYLRTESIRYQISSQVSLKFFMMFSRELGLTLLTKYTIYIDIIRYAQLTLLCRSFSPSLSQTCFHRPYINLRRSSTLSPIPLLPLNIRFAGIYFSLYLQYLDFSRTQLYIYMALVVGVALIRGVLLVGVRFCTRFFSRFSPQFYRVSLEVGCFLSLDGFVVSVFSYSQLRIRCENIWVDGCGFRFLPTGLLPPNGVNLLANRTVLILSFKKCL